MSPTSFRHDAFAEAADRFHGRDLLSDPTPRVVECHAAGPALVLGSVQRFEVVDESAASARGVAVTRRRSGGGAVLVEPDGLVWFDVVVPSDDQRFAASWADVTASMCWLGGHVLTALGSLGVTGLAMHDGPMVLTEWGRLVCFASIAPGEITLDGEKLVGISQRRTRQGSRFQCAVHTVWSPDVLLALLVPPKPAVGELPAVAVLAPDIARALPGALVRGLNAL